MKAMLLTDDKQLELTDVPAPDVGEDEVMIRVGSCGICGSDIHGFDGSSGRRIPPLVMGHEAAGRIERLGSNVTDLREGDRVTFDSMLSCGDCWFCRRGAPNLCDDRQVLGVSCGDYRRHGAFAEYVVVPRRIVYPLPDELSTDHAATIEPLSIAVHATDLTPIELGDVAAVVGAGMIGQLMIRTLRLAGCAQVVAIDLDDSRLEMARRGGADATVNPKTEDVAEAMRQRTDGRGADVAVEAVGNSAALNTTLDCLRKGGTATLIGNVSPTAELPMQAVVTRQLRLIGSCAQAGRYERCIDLLARGRIDVESLITARSPLEEGPRWFDRLYQQEPGLMKVLLRPFDDS